MAAVIRNSPATVTTTPAQMPTKSFRACTIKLDGSGSDVLYIVKNGSTPSSTNWDYKLTAGQSVEILADEVKQSHDIIVVSDTSSVVGYSL